jgi:4-amino-4-deoxy-L-arabinose transferase-like glycosyltransferase
MESAHPPIAGMKASRTRDLLFIALGVAFLLGPHLGRRALWEPDEARYSEIPREMLATGDWVTPRINGIRYFEKPPLFYWAEAASMRFFGVSDSHDAPAPRELPQRLALALFALLGIASVYLVGREVFGRRAALLGSAVLATTPLYFGLGNAITLDLPVSALLTVALLAFLNATTKPPGWERRPWLWGFFVAAALATLTKGLIGVVVPAMVIGPWILVTRRWQLIALALQPSGLLLFVAVAAPWHLLAAQANSDFLWFYFVHEHFQRYLSKVHLRYEPPWFFVPVLLGGMLPWSAFLPRALGSALRAKDERRGETLFLVLWAGMVFLFFSLSSSKLIPYILPAVPPLALLIGRELATIWEGGRFPRGVPLALALITLPIGIALVYPGLPLTSKGLLYSQTLGGFRYFLAASLILLGGVPFALQRLGRRRPAVVAYVVTSALFLTALFAPLLRFDALRSAKGVAEILRPRLRAGDEVAVYRDYMHGLAFYLERRITVVDYLGELEFGVRSEPATRAWMIDLEELRRRWMGPGVVYTVVDRRYPKRLAAVRGRLIGESGPYLVLINR